MKLAIALGLVACDAQVDGDFAGDARARLRGVAVGFDADAAIDGAAVRWTAQLAADLAGPTTALPLEAAPPAVVVPVIALPPEAARFGFDGDPVRLAEGAVLLTDGDAVVGAAIGVALVHVDGEVQPGSLAADYLGGAAAPGYHLYDVHATAGLGAAQAYFAQRCGGTPACVEPRRYRLVATPDDLATELQFFRGGR